MRALLRMLTLLAVAGLAGCGAKEPTGIKREKKEGESSGSAAGGLHAEQHFTYHRHLRPGDVLTGTTDRKSTRLNSSHT